MTPELRKIVEKVAKLQRLAAAGSGATEHEAQLAADMAAEISMEHGITTAMLELSGGQGEAREKTELQGGAGEWWQPPLMEALCETCFVWHERRLRQDKADRFLGAGYRLIGRESAVEAPTRSRLFLQCIRRGHGGLRGPRARPERGHAARPLPRHDRAGARGQRAEAQREEGAARLGGSGAERR